MDVDSDSDLSLVPEPEPKSRTTGGFCNLCGAWRVTRTCPSCDVEIELQDYPDSAPRDEDSDDSWDDAPRIDEDQLVPPGYEGLEPDGTEIWKPLREFDPHEVPTGPGRLLKRAFWAGLAGYVPIVYFPLIAIPITFQRIPWVAEAFPWPGQALATYVIGFCLLERTRAAREESKHFDVLELGGVLWRTLVFFFPLLLGIGSLTYGAWEALLWIPIAAVLLPLVLGALSTDDWGEIHPSAVAVAWRETPNYGLTVLLSSGGLAVALVAVWGFPDGNSLLRGLVATLGAMVGGAVAGAARRDAEITSPQIGGRSD